MYRVLCMSPTQQERRQLLSANEAGLAARALARRHRVLQAVVVPFSHRLMHYRTMHYELSPSTTTRGVARSLAAPDRQEPPPVGPFLGARLRHPPRVSAFPIGIRH